MGDVSLPQRTELKMEQQFVELTHGLQAKIVEQAPDSIPQTPLAAHLLPHSLKQAIAQLLRLIDQKRQHRSEERRVGKECRL